MTLVYYRKFYQLTLFPCTTTASSFCRGNTTVLSRGRETSGAVWRRQHPLSHLPPLFAHWSLTRVAPMTAVLVFDIPSVNDAPVPVVDTDVLVMTDKPLVTDMLDSCLILRLLFRVPVTGVDVTYSSVACKPPDGGTGD